MSESFFRRVRAGDLISGGILRVEDGNHGEYRPRREEFSSEGTAFVRAADLKASGIAFWDAEKINKIARARIRKGIGAPGDTILSHKGTVGKVAYAEIDSPLFVCSPQTTFWRSLDHNRIDPRFMYYALRSNAFQDQLSSLKGESDMAPYVSLTEQRKLWLDLPPIGVQLAVSTVLGALDDKIAVNERIAERSYELLQVLWKEAAQGVTEFVAVSQKAGLDKGLSYKGSGLGSGVPLVNLANFGTDGRFKDSQIKHYAGEARDRHWVANGDLVMANTDLTQRRVILGQPAIVTIDKDRALFSHHVYAIRLNRDAKDDNLWLYGAFREAAFRERAVTYATGTTVVALPREAVLTYELPWPGRETRQKWTRVARGLINGAEARVRESRCLSQLRDTLLPKLMSGEIRVRDAEKAVEDAP